MKLGIIAAFAVTGMLMHSAGHVELPIKEVLNRFKSFTLTENTSFIEEEISKKQWALKQKSLELARVGKPLGIPTNQVCKYYAEYNEAKFKLPYGYLQAIILKESGKTDNKSKKFYAHPWTISLNFPQGNKAFYLKDRTTAEKKLKELLSKGYKNIDIGCGQINYKWHVHNKLDLDKIFDPKYNLSYSAKYLSSLKVHHKTWNEAVGRYHSATVDKKIRYRNGVMHILKHKVLPLNTDNKRKIGVKTYASSH
jgi:hypothetical protein